MSAAIKVLKAISGFFGSVFMLLAIILLFLTLIANSMNANIDKFDSSIASTTNSFVQENKADMRKFVLDTMEKQGFELTINMTKVLCASPSMLNMAGEIGSTLKSALTPEVCDNIDAAPFEETKAKFIDKFIENNINTLLELPQTEELKNMMGKYFAELTSYNPMLYGTAIGMFLLGAFLTFTGVGFNWKRGTYKVCIKTGIRLATIALLLFILSLVTADKIIDTMKLIESQAPQMMVSSAPLVLLKLISAIILEWMKLSTNPYILVAFISAIPFIGAAVVMRFTILKNPKEENKNPADRKVV